MQYYILNFDTMQLLTDQHGKLIQTTIQDLSPLLREHRVEHYDLLVNKEQVDELKQQIINFKTDSL